MQANSIQSSQNFGMAMRINENSIQTLSRNLGKQKNIDKFQKLFTSQEKNPFDVNIATIPNSKKLIGYVADGSTYYKQHKKGFFTSTIKWIENMCKDANAQLQEKNLQASLENVLKS